MISDHPFSPMYTVTPTEPPSTSLPQLRGGGGGVYTVHKVYSTVGRGTVTRASTVTYNHGYNSQINYIFS